jgi:hypothetical protein
MDKDSCNDPKSSKKMAIHQKFFINLIKNRKYSKFVDFLYLRKEQRGKSDSSAKTKGVK